MMNLSIVHGSTMVLLPRFDVVKVLRSIAKYKVTEFPGVPTMYAMIITHPDIAKYNISSVRFCISGAAPLPPQVQKRFMELTGGILIEDYKGPLTTFFKGRVVWKRPDLIVSQGKYSSLEEVDKFDILIECKNLSFE